MVKALKEWNHKAATWVIAIAILAGMCAGILHLFMRFANNTQGEMFDDAGHVDLAYSTILFLVAFVPVFVAIAVSGAACHLMWRLFRRTG